MFTRSDKSKQHKNRSAAASVRQEKREQEAVFADKRSVTASLHALQLEISGATKGAGYTDRSLTRGLEPCNANGSSLQRVVQFENFDAGEGGKWHIHYGHIKLGNNEKSRVNFNDRTKKEIKRELGEKINRHGLNVDGDLAQSFRECINYINAHY